MHLYQFSNIVNSHLFCKAIALENVALRDCVLCGNVQDFREKAMAILNSMVGMKYNAPVKDPTHFQGKFKVIMSSLGLWEQFDQAFTMYASENLKNPNTQTLYQNMPQWQQSNMTYMADPIAPSTFRHVRGFGEFILRELLDKIMRGVSEDGFVVAKENPKVILEKIMPRKFKKWTSIANLVERRRWKNAILYQLQSLKLAENVWVGNDQMLASWKAWKARVGFRRPYMDELLCRAGELLSIYYSILHSHFLYVIVHI